MRGEWNTCCEFLPASYVCSSDVIIDFWGILCGDKTYFLSISEGKHGLKSAESPRVQLRVRLA